MVRRWSNYDRRRKRVLFVEDEPQNVRVTQARLQRSGHQTKFATNVSEAETLLRNERFDVLVVDIRLPDKPEGVLDFDGGLTLIKQLRGGVYGEENRATPFIILTGQKRSLDLGGVQRLGGCLGVEKKLTQYRTVDIINDC